MLLQHDTDLVEAECFKEVVSTSLCVREGVTQPLIIELSEINIPPAQCMAIWQSVSQLSQQCWTGHPLQHLHCSFLNHFHVQISVNFTFIYLMRDYSPSNNGGPAPFNAYAQEQQNDQQANKLAEKLTLLKDVCFI